MVKHPTVGGLSLTRSPIRMEGADIRPAEAPPLLGQHTAEVLAELGIQKAELEEPIRRIQAYLAGLGIWDDATQAAVEGEIAEQMDAAVEAAAELPAAKATDVFDNVYADPPLRVLRQREELLRMIGQLG